MLENDSVLNLAFAHGLSPIRSCVVNLSNKSGEKIFFVSSNTAVIQGLDGNEQTVLQGHTNPITCVTHSSDASIVVTGEAGVDSVLIVWDTSLGAMRLKVSKPHKYGVIAMDMNSLSGLLVTLSDTGREAVAQEISLWDVSSMDKCKNLITVPIPAGDLQTCVAFNHADPKELVTNGKRRSFFWQSCLPASAAFKYYSPPLSGPDFKQKVGMFTVSTFIPGTTQAITGTQDGDVVVWDHQGISAEIGTRHTDRKATKLMRLHSASLTWLSTIANFIITGADDGHVRFFDPMLRLIAWFENIEAGPVRSVSFSRARPAAPSMPAFDTFLCPDFLVGSSRGAIMLMTANAFNTTHDEHRRGKQVMHGLVGELVTCCAHPLRPHFLLVGASGALQVWDAVRCTLLLTTRLELGGAQLSCATYARSGATVVVGTTIGAVIILKGDNLSVVERFKNSRTAITAVSISSKAQHIAAATADGFMQLMFLVPYKSTMRWEYVGRAKVHYSPIIAVHFGEAPSGETRCFSLSEDGRLAEYDIVASSLEAGLLVGEQVSACLHATPTAMCFTPPLSYFQRGVVDTQLVIADSSYHMRVFNPDNSVTSGTYRSPTCGDPLTQMVMFQTADTDRTLVAFRSNNQAAGVMLWPTDGHPASMAAILAHPGDIASVAVSCDGRRLLTASKDGHVNQWHINGLALSARTEAVGSGPKRWQPVLGSDISFEEVQRYFLLSQVRAAGDNISVPREVMDSVPLASIPELMCALGYYPAQSAVTDMISSLAYMAAMKKEPKPSSVDLTEVEKAFKTLGGTKQQNLLTAERLEEVLTTMGEAMEADELKEALNFLTGKESLEEAAALQISPQVFACNILGFESVPQTGSA